MTQDATTKAIAASNGYYECGTAAGTAAKVAVGDNEALYTLQKGGSIKVKMTNANAAASGVTLKVGSANATPLYYNGAAVSASNTWEAGEVVEVYYDGSVYQASNSQGGGGKAEKIKYDNSQSGLASDNVQDGIDELSQNVAEDTLISSHYQSLPSRTTTYYTLAFDFVVGAKYKFVVTFDSAISNSVVTCLTTSPSSTTDRIVLRSTASGSTTDEFYYTPESSNYKYLYWYSNSATSFTLAIYRVETIKDISSDLYDDLKFVKSLSNDDFVRGSNNSSGITYTEYRCITPQFIEVDENTTITVTNNGQYHVMLTYASDGTYESTTGWVSTNAVYGFNSAKKVRFLVSWNGGTSITIAPSQITTTFSISRAHDAIDELNGRVTEIESMVDVTDITLVNSDFIQGSNNTDDFINVNSKARCITLYQYDVDADTIITVKNNGQAHVMLTYASDGTYETTTGWITADSTFTYTFSAAKKVRFVVSWDGSATTTIVPSQITAAFNIHHKSEVEKLAEDIGDSATTKANDTFCRYNKKISVYNPYKDHPTNQYKGQMHCHTTNSDGALAPAAVVAKYIGYGYDFMTITDHNYITPNPSPNADIVWMGNSYEDTCSTAGLQHMNVWNCTEVLNYVDMYHSTNTPSQIVKHFVKNGDSVVSYNHPEYPTVYASDETLANLPVGISFVEIYNSTIQTLLGTVDSLPTTANYGDMVIYNGTRYINHSTTKNSPNWQATTAEANPDGNLDRGFRIMLDNGHKVFCDAVDDFHRGDNMENRGWQIVFAHSRTKQSIWNGLLMGASYASTGVSLNDVSFLDGVFKLDIADGASAVTTFYGYNNEVLGTANGATAMYEVTGDEKYVRAMVEIEGKKAWTQPVWIIAVGDQYEF